MIFCLKSNWQINDLSTWSLNKLTISLQISNCIVESLLTHFAQNFWMSWEQNSCDTVKVGWSNRKGSINQIDLKQVERFILRTNVWLAGKRRHSYSVFAYYWQIVAESPVDIGNPVELGRHQTGPNWNEARALNSLANETRATRHYWTIASALIEWYDRKECVGTGPILPHY